MRRLLLSALIIFAALPAAPAFAQDGLDRRVVIINETNESIFFLYGSNQGEPGWQEDILGDDVLSAGDTVRVDFDDGTGYCVFDFKVEFEGGREQTDFGINVCEIGRYTFR